MKTGKCSITFRVCYTKTEEFVTWRTSYKKSMTHKAKLYVWKQVNSLFIYKRVGFLICFCICLLIAAHLWSIQSVHKSPNFFEFSLILVCGRFRHDPILDRIIINLHNVCQLTIRSPRPVRQLVCLSYVSLVRLW